MQYNTNNIISVSVLTNRIRSVLETDFTGVVVKGEISNYKLHSSGHRYFTLKDDKSQIKCVMWKSRSLNFDPSDGMKIIATGNITVYPPQGNYQLECNSLRLDGQGDLYLAFEELKFKLQDKGYFDSSSKKSLPNIPLNIGISTSPTGAAIQDMITTLKRRAPFVKVYFRPTLVQGEGSANDIASAIFDLEQSPAEIIILGRGGGSIEDLWSYNTEIVADAIFNCNKPIISAVGHETDFTISDFTADFRAATPTAAAETASRISYSDLINFLDESFQKQYRFISQQITNYKTGILEGYEKLSTRRIQDYINYNRQMIDNAESQLTGTMKYDMKNRLSSLQRMVSHITSLNPLAPFDKGFAALKYNDKYIGKNQSLLDFDKIEIVRKKENINVKIIKENKK